MMTFCPATMCPLFASDGSPWTGDVNSPCDREPCGWWRGGQCQGAVAAHTQVAEVAEGGPLLQIGTVHARRTDRRRPTRYDCPRAHECQWQADAEAEGGICPPRTALALGVDPRACAY